MQFDTHDIGTFFWHLIKLKKKSPIVHRFPSHEDEYPYRRSNSLILRLPGSSIGLVAGHWRPTGRTEEQMILDSLQGREIGYDSPVEAW